MIPDSPAFNHFDLIFNHITKRLETELSSNYSYHQLSHTIYVLNASETIANWEGIEGEDLYLLKIAALYHDAGFLITHEEHEQHSQHIAREELPGYGLSNQQIDRICAMIQATRIPQTPLDRLSCILCDADLFYLGFEAYDETAGLLFTELRSLNKIDSNKEWLVLQINFLSKHSYHTDSVRNRLSASKNQHLERLKLQHLDIN
jgi:uncharacterized protein